MDALTFRNVFSSLFEEAREMAWNIAAAAHIFITNEEECQYAEEYFNRYGVETINRQRMMRIIADDYDG